MYMCCTLSGAEKKIISLTVFAFIKIIITMMRQCEREREMKTIIVIIFVLIFASAKRGFCRVFSNNGNVISVSNVCKENNIFLTLSMNDTMKTLKLCVHKSCHYARLTHKSNDNFKTILC